MISEFSAKYYFSEMQKEILHSLSSSRVTKCCYLSDKFSAGLFLPHPTLKQLLILRKQKAYIFPPYERFRRDFANANWFFMG